MTDDNRVRLLYHFTALETLPDILRSGELRPSDRSVSREGPAFDVVWLTDDDNPGHGADHGLGTDHGLDTDAALGSGLDKRAVRFTVAVGDAQHWLAWASRYKVSNRTRRQIDEAGGGLSARWWVAPRPIPQAQWLRVQNLATGEVLWPQVPAQGTASP